jgi:lipoprotein signal peptidase
MIFGMFIGSGIGVTAFVITNNALFFTVTGFGIIFGLGIGNLWDRRKRQLT